MADETQQPEEQPEGQPAEEQQTPEAQPDAAAEEAREEIQGDRPVSTPGAEGDVSDDVAAAEGPTTPVEGGGGPATGTPEPSQPTEPAEPTTEPAEPTPAVPESPIATAAGEGAVEPDLGLDIGSGAGTETAEPAAAPVVRGKIDRFGVAMGTGRRKTSVARVRVQQGDGKLSINGRSLAEYFPREGDQKSVEAPLHATEMHGKVDVWVRVDGGGTTGQSGAVVLGIARALQAMEPGLHGPLSDGGYLTRDGRMVERKKYGYKKARRSFQFSKR